MCVIIHFEGSKKTHSVQTECSVRTGTSPSYSSYAGCDITKKLSVLYTVECDDTHSSTDMWA